jgi:hypothetical protein
MDDPQKRANGTVWGVARWRSEGSRRDSLGPSSLNLMKSLVLETTFVQPAQAHPFTVRKQRPSACCPWYGASSATRLLRRNLHRRPGAFVLHLSAKKVRELVRIRLYPSDLSFRWNACRFCFWLKCRYGVAMRPPFPEVFNHIDAAMKEAFHGRNLRSVASIPDDWPDGTIDCSSAIENVRSQEFEVTTHAWVRFTITGRLDGLIRFQDETLGVLDFKVSRAETSKLQETYAMQLHAYAFALEKAANLLDADDTSIAPVPLPPAVPRLALIVFRPDGYELLPSSHESCLRGQTEFIPIERDDEGFYALCQEIAALFERPEPPAPSKHCETCSFYAARYPFQS